jgi:quinol monooxygenase YgiN
MPVPAVYLLVELSIQDGQLDALLKVAGETIAGSQGEAGTLGYEWFLSADGKRCRLLESYASAEALLSHLKGPVVQQLVPKMLPYVTVDGFEVFGDPGPEAAAMLANFSAQMFEHWGGLKR